MPEPPSATPPHPPRALSVNQPERSAPLTDRQPRAGAREQSRRALARQHALVAAWLRDLLRHS